MKLRLPANYSDLTLKHLQVLETSTDPVARVQAVTGLTFAELRKMPHQLITKANAHIEQLMAGEISLHKRIITLDGVEYGFVPDWEDFSVGEWIDLETYTNDFWKTAPKAMSILYRPITRKWGDKYTVADYTAKEDPKPFEAMPAPMVAGALLFFWTTEHELLGNLKSSLLQTARAAMSLLTSGDGIPRSTPWLGRMFSRWTKYRASRLATSSPTSPTSRT